MFVIDFEQVNAPREALIVITIRHLNTQSSNKNTRKKCEICQGGNYSEKNVWGEFHAGNLLPRGELFRGNCSVVVVFGGIIQG